jgi:ABC-type cobalamin/Fe3+-siderophores transport system ATPase subunit
METVVKFTDVGFAYPAEDDSEESQVFGSVTAELPGGMVSVVGQNGVGKSTLLLLAGARLFPDAGTISIFDSDAGRFRDAGLSAQTEEERNRLVSFVYQNMEFETTEPVGDLMIQVYENGYHEERSDEFLARIRSELELDAILARKTQELAKGQLQRAIIGFSLLYGSRMIIMDEPVFAVEEPQKDRVFSFLFQWSRDHGVPVYYSVHNLDLSRRFADHTVLFTGPGEFVVGATSEVLTRDRLEAAYSAPIDTLYERDKLYRQMLIQREQRA